MPLTDYATSPRRTWSNGQPGQLYYPDNAIRQWAHRTVEKIKVSSLAGRIRFLPLYDIYTGETSEIRQEYRRMLRDETVKAAFQAKLFAVISEPVQVHPVDPDNPRDREARDFAVYALKKVKGGTAGVGWSLLSGLLIDGHSIAERVWDLEPKRVGKWSGKRCWYAIKAKDPHFLQLGIDPFRNVDALRGSGYNAGRVWNPADFVITSYFSLFEDPAGVSDFRAAYRSYWIKDTSMTLRGLHLEKFTGPYLMGTYSGIDQKEALEDALAEANQGTWCTVPAGAMVEAIDLSAKGTTDFKDAIADCERQILVAILGAHLQVQEGQTSGARGNTEVHKQTSELPAWYLTSLLQRGYQQLVDELYAENWIGIEPGEVTIGAVSEAEMQEYTAIDKSLQEMGFKLSRKAMARRYSREEATDEADVLSPQGGEQEQQQPAAFAEGGPPGPFGRGGLLSPVWHRFSEDCGCADCESLRRFCQEGENAGLPGPCPEGKEAGPGKVLTTPLAVYRGFPDPSHAQSMRQGRPHVGEGDYGNGTYLSTDPHTAASYAAGPEGDAEGEVVHAAITPGARVVPAAEVEKLHQAAVEAGKIAADLDLGTFARRQGIDAISVPHKGYVNVVNPAVLRITHALPLSEHVRRFCTEGPNAGKPGPCPEGDGGREPARPYGAPVNPPTVKDEEERYSPVGEGKVNMGGFLRRVRDKSVHILDSLPEDQRQEIQGYTQREGFELLKIPVKGLIPTQQGIDRINESSRNSARTIASGDLSKIAKADLAPLVVTGEPGAYRILDGNHKFSAAQMNGQQYLYAWAGAATPPPDAPR